MKGSRARLLIDSIGYLDKVERRNKGVTFFELRDKITSDWMYIFKSLTNVNRLKNTMSDIYAAAKNVPVPIIPYSLDDLKSGPIVYDLSGKKFKLQYTLLFDKSAPFMNPLEEYMFDQELEALKRGKIRWTQYDFIRKLTSGAAVGKVGDHFMMFGITLRNMNLGLLKKAFHILGTYPIKTCIEKEVKSNTTHELIHTLDPRRNSKRKTYDISNSRAYTDHIIERASKLNDAFGERFEALRNYVKGGSLVAMRKEMAKFYKDKLVYVDKYIVENVDAKWSRDEDDVEERRAFAPGLYAYAISAVDNYFKRAPWVPLEGYVDAVIGNIRRIKSHDLNGYYQEKLKFTTNPGYYLDCIQKGTDPKISQPFELTLIGPKGLSNTDVYGYIHDKLKQRGFHD